MFSVNFDTAEKRIKTDLLWLPICGSDWRPAQIDGSDEDDKVSSNVWVEPFNKLAMLMPLPLTDGYHENHSGSYAKFTKANLGAGSNWEEINNVSTGDVYLHSVGDVSAETLTTPSLDDNQAVFVSFFAFNSGSDVFEQLRLSWENEVELRIFSNLRTEVWVAGAFKFAGSIASPKGSKLAENAPAQPGSKQTRGERIELILLPYNGKDLLVYSGAGGGFVYSFLDLEDDDPITEGPLSIQCPSPNAANQLQVAKCGFRSSGFLLSRTMVFRRAPESTQTYAYDFDIDANGQTVGTPALVDSETLSAFTANGSNDSARVKVTLSGSGFKTPFVSWWAGGFLPEFAETDDSEEADVAEYLKRFSLSVDSTGKNTSLTLQFVRPFEAPVTGLNEQLSRAINLTADGVTVFEGRTEAPAWTLGKTDETAQVEISANDAFKGFDSYMFSDVIPLDGATLQNAVKFLIRLGGKDPDTDAIVPDFDGFTLPESPTAAAGDWAVKVDVGETLGSAIARLIDTYAGLYTYGFRPTSTGIKFVIKEDDESEAAAFEVFKTTAEAKAHCIDTLLLDEEEATKRAHEFTFSAYRDHWLEPEANIVFVTGEEKRTGRPIFATVEDPASADPTTAPSERPSNWLGLIRKYGLVDPEITTADVAERTADILFERLSKKRLIAEWSAYLQFDDDGVSIWRGDVITVGTIGKFRITSMSCDIDKDADDFGITSIRKARFTGECLELY